ncbi:MAG: rRNA maturation RNase YbeY [Gammaproteobacteria bacterium]|nr:rRNA maturation RNase YbeY [Gammaproteobacteria bacterium]
MSRNIDNLIPEHLSTKAEFTIEIQQVCRISQQPDADTILKWATTVLEIESTGLQLELCIRIVDTDEMRELNGKYRNKPTPTNVLSFPAEWISELPVQRLGDLVICAPVVNQQAVDQGKPIEAHWAHMVVHGILHLCGYDHNNDVDAQLMEQREKTILEKFGFDNPYEVKL